MVIIALVGVFFWIVVLGDKGVYHLRKLMDMKYRLTAERQTLSREIDELTEERQILSDPANLEMVVRQELGYIRPGEVVFEEKKNR